ncbi:MAG: GntR family transcriptional regulator [Pseudomonadota bacterium]
MENVTTAESLTSKAYAQLRAAIIAGELEPGKKLKIDELRQTYGYGGSPIREALSLLTSDGLVARLEQRGFNVTDVSREEFSELLKTRCWLEDRALRESIDHGGEEWEEQVILAHHWLSREPRFTDVEGAFVANEAWEARHKAFHMALISACGSSILLRMCDQLYDQNIRYRILSGAAAYPGRNVGDEHASIMQAALDRDADLAVTKMVEHYNKTGAFLKERL